jgi:hypothetical protein
MGRHPSRARDKDHDDESRQRREAGGKIKQRRFEPPGKEIG